jgi:hypothetical protein
MKVFGDLDVKRAIVGEVRVDQGLRVATISATETLTKNSYSWQKLTAAAPQDVNLPDATTLPIKGWAVVIQAITSALTVKNSAGTTIKVVGAGETFRFTVQDISTAAGVWDYRALPTSYSPGVSKYAQDFDATTDWGTAGGGLYTLAITGATHGMGTNPTVVVYETTSTTESKVELDVDYDNVTGDVSLIVPEVPDCRFAGRVVIM